jgi:hypothetical protein
MSDNFHLQNEKYLVKFNSTKFNAVKYRLFRETYPQMPLSVVCITNPGPNFFTPYDLV